jgi:hypothetical protein
MNHPSPIKNKSEASGELNLCPVSTRFMGELKAIPEKSRVVLLDY